MTNAPILQGQYEGSAPDGRGRVSLVGRAVKTWTGELVDLGGRNTLLYYRDLKQGTLDIGPGSGADAVAVETLDSSQTVRLSTMFGETAMTAAARRARTVKAKTTENYEERGLQTLFLAWGMATWTNSVVPPHLPRRYCSARPRSAREVAPGKTLTSALPGEWEVNPTLLHLLKTDYGIELDRVEVVGLLDQDAAPPDPAVLFERLTKSCADIPGFGMLHGSCWETSPTPSCLWCSTWSPRPIRCLALS